MGVSIALGKRFERLADYLISIGRFGNRSEVVRHAMLLLEESEFNRGYIHKEKEFSVLLSGYAHLSSMERELSYPSAKTRTGPDGKLIPEVISFGREYVSQRLERLAERDEGAPLAKDDPRPTRAERRKSRKIRDET